VSAALEKGNLVVMPVDCVYGIVGILNESVSAAMTVLTRRDRSLIERLVPSFKMLDPLAEIDKLQFDFLHRIWPGEIVVRLQAKDSNDGTVALRMPRSKYVQDLMMHLDSPLYFTTGCGYDEPHAYKKNDVIRKFSDKSDCIVIVNEFCKEHNQPSVVDISNGALEIINQGRISVEEIKSLYFLGKDDAAL
jgi:tRNA A37 threonylcarbamoyladenosine synthetase subunit TsaC/SUA5/YrdC